MRPSLWNRLRDRRCLHSVARSTCLVSMSATFSEPRTFTNLKSLDLTRSCTHKSAVAKCLILPRPRRRHMHTAAVESVPIVMSHVRPRSFATEISPMDIDAPLVIPPNSASPEDNVTVLWVRLQCLMRCPPRRAAPPEVDLRVDKQPAKSVSTEAKMESPHFWNPNFQTSLGTPIKYRISLLRASTACPFGWATHRQSSLVQNERSGRFRAN